MNLKIKQSGFSLIEMIVSVGIIAFLSIMVTLNYNSFGKKSAVTMAAQNLASDIRRAQSYAFNGKIDGSNDGSWGVYLDVSSAYKYIIFADKDGDNSRTDASEDYLSVDLPKNVKIKDINPGTSFTVTYVPPDPKVVINDSPTISSSTITLSDSDGNNEKKVEVNIFGLVDVQ